MNWGDQLDALGATVFRMSLDAAILALILAAGLALFGRWLTARARFVLWLVIPIRLILFVSWPSPVSLLNTTPAFEFRAAARETIELPPSHYSIGPKQFARTVLPPSTKNLGFRALVIAWFAGMVVLGGYFSWRYILLRSKVAKSRKITSPDVLTLFDETCEMTGHKGPCELVEFADLATPALLGRGKILLPPGVLERNSRDEVRCALIHELIHLRRKDHWLNLGLITFQIVHWFNPLVWWACGRTRDEMELTCDEQAVAVLPRGSRRLYCESLLSFQSPVNQTVSFLSFSLSRSAGELATRIANLARPPATVRQSGICYALVFGFACAALGDRKTASAPSIAEGFVVDNISGAPVRDFHVEALRTVSVSPGHDLQLSSGPTAGLREEPGGFRLKLAQTPGATHWKLRVDAPGYEEFVSLNFESLPRHVTVRLQPKD